MKQLSKKLISSIGFRLAMHKWLMKNVGIDDWFEKYNEYSSEGDYIRSLCKEEDVYSMEDGDFHEFLGAYTNPDKFQLFCQKYGYAA